MRTKMISTDLLFWQPQSRAPIMPTSHIVLESREGAWPHAHSHRAWRHVASQRAVCWHGACLCKFQGTYRSLISWISCRNSSAALKHWHCAKIPGCLKLSFEAVSKQGLRYPKRTLDGIPAPEYQTSQNYWKMLLFSCSPTLQKPNIWGCFTFLL